MNNNFNTDTDDVFEQWIHNAVHMTTIHNEDKINVYFAGPWFDERANELYDACVEIGNAYYDKIRFYYPKNYISDKPSDVFNSNLANIDTSDVIIALVSRKDVGTAWEIGYAQAKGKKIFLLGYDETTFLCKTNLMLAFTGKCLTIDKYAEFLMNRCKLSDCKYVNIQNKWEGIE